MRQVPEVEIDLGGQIRHLRFDFEAIYRFKQATGIDLTAGQGWRADQMLDVLPELIRACLYRESPDLTVTEVRSWLWYGNLIEVLSKIDELRRSSTPEKEEDQEGQGDPLASSTSGL